jgi:hypothetical protein
MGYPVSCTYLTEGNESSPRSYHRARIATCSRRMTLLATLSALALNAVAASLLGWTAWTAFQSREQPSAEPFSALLATLTLWAVLAFGSNLPGPASGTLLSTILDVARFGTALVIPGIWTVYALSYTGRGTGLTWRRMALLAGIAFPVLLTSSHGFSRGIPRRGYSGCAFPRPARTLSRGASAVAVRLRPRTCFAAHTAGSTRPSSPVTPGVCNADGGVFSPRGRTGRGTRSATPCMVHPPVDGCSRRRSGRRDGHGRTQDTQSGRRHVCPRYRRPNSVGRDRFHLRLCICLRAHHGTLR